MGSILLSLRSFLRRDNDSNNGTTRALCSTRGLSDSVSSRSANPCQAPEIAADPATCSDGYVPFPAAVSKGQGWVETSKPLSRRLYLGLRACVRTRRRRRPAPRQRDDAGLTATSPAPEGDEKEPDMEEGLVHVAQPREMVHATPPVKSSTTKTAVKPRLRSKAAVPQVQVVLGKTDYSGISKRKRKARAGAAAKFERNNRRGEAVTFANSIWQRTIPGIAESLIFWVDGSFQKPTRQGGAAVVLSRGEAPLTFEAFAMKGVADSLEVELYAIDAALEGAIFETRGIRGFRIFILSDCTGAIECATANNKPKKRTGSTKQLVENIARRLHTLHVRGCAVEMRWVPGHAGATGNVYADRIAGFACNLAGQIAPRSDGGIEVHQVAATLLSVAVKNIHAFRGHSTGLSDVAPVPDPHAGRDPQVVVQEILDAHWAT